MFLNVVTAAPGCSWATMRETDSSAVVECSTMKDRSCSERIAPRAKPVWPPEEDQYSLPSDSEAHWPRKSTSRVALMATKLSSPTMRSEEHTTELQSRQYLVCCLLLEK